MNTRGFHDRRDAGRRLAARLMSYANRPDVLVLALPRGGVPVGFEVASVLHVPLDVIVVRKLGVPGHEELAMGAIASGGVRVLNTEIIEQLGISEEIIDQVTGYEQQEMERRERLYRGDRPPYDVHNRIILLVDDGIATGATIRAAATAIRQQQSSAKPFGKSGIIPSESSTPEDRGNGAWFSLFPQSVGGYCNSRVIIAVPVAPFLTCVEFTREGEELVCLIKPEVFFSVSSWYAHFAPTTDAEVHDLLARKQKEL
jgi:putative phosphoribosyl transferase